jgi:EAL domain-containing protein (putative c-di-GMP-specific phosphodiesterase class I)
MDAENTVSLLKNADIAMYKAKEQGRNGYVFYEENSNLTFESRNQTENIIYNALDANSFYLAYQPQIDCNSGKIVGVEALIRIKDEKYGDLLPAEFIEVADELGVMGQIDEWVVREACRQYSIWQGKGYLPMRMAINLSGRLLQDDNVLEKYMGIIKEFEIDPKAIQFEVTENTLCKNEKKTIEMFEYFKNQGVSIAVDHFGTEQSSLKCIQMYPMDTLKIDRTFVRASTSGSKDVAIIKGLLSIANSLQMNIVVVGVETAQEYKLLQSLGCDMIQGYYFSKPCSGKELEMFLKTEHVFDIN